MRRLFLPLCALLLIPSLVSAGPALRSQPPIPLVLISSPVTIYLRHKPLQSVVVYRIPSLSC